MRSPAGLVRRFLDDERGNISVISAVLMIVVVVATVHPKIAFLDQQASFQQRHYDMAFAGAEHLVVLARGEPIGRFYLDRRSRRLRVVDISLLPEWRGRGLGAALLDMLQQEAREP